MTASALGTKARPASSRFELPSLVVSFAVVIPAHNDEGVVSAAIASALEQEGVAEVVVVDDGSTDRTFERVQNSQPPVRCISQRNSGPAAARNLGAASTHSDHLVFLDADDLLLEGALNRFADGHATGAELVRASSQSRSIDGVVEVAQPRPWPQPFPRGTPLAGSFSIDAAVFRELGGYDELFRYGENSELLMRAAIRLDPESSRIAFLADPSVEVRKRTARSDSHYDESRLAAVDRMLEIHGDTLRADPETLRSHLLVASELERRRGRRGDAVRLASRAARLGPVSARSLLRVCRAAMPPSPKVS